jgi:hypothetical protein
MLRSYGLEIVTDCKSTINQRTTVQQTHVTINSPADKKVAIESSVKSDNTFTRYEIVYVLHSANNEACGYLTDIMAVCRNEADDNCEPSSGMPAQSTPASLSQEPIGLKFGCRVGCLCVAKSVPFQTEPTTRDRRRLSLRLAPCYCLCSPSK